MASRVYTNVSRAGYREYRGGEVSPKPYLQNLPYRHERITFSGGAGAVNGSTAIGPSQSHLNALYARFRDKARGDTSQLLTAAVEWKSSLDTITKRLLQLRRAFLALRRFDLPGMARHLGRGELNTPAKVKGQRRPRKGRKKSRYRYQRPTEAWLEYWMMWAPSVNDIYNAVTNICNPYPDQKITVGVTRHYKSTQRSGNPGLSSSYYDEIARREVITLAAYGKMRVTNHNLFLANQLGLLNPAQTAWEIVPFSFMIDWHLNLGQVLGSLTDFAGLSLFDSGQARLDSINYVNTGFTKQYDPATRTYVSKPYTRLAQGEIKTRSPGRIPSPSLTLRFDRLSLTRAATANSLLIEALISGRKQK